MKIRKDCNKLEENRRWDVLAARRTRAGMDAALRVKKHRNEMVLVRLAVHSVVTVGCTEEICLC